MRTPAQLCLEVRRLCKDWGLGTTTLAVAITNTAATSITLTDVPEDLQAGVLLEVGTELMEVRTTGVVMDVRRGVYGTTAATALIGSMVVFQPRYTNTAIIEALNRALWLLSHKRPRHQRVTDATLLVTTDDQEEYTLPAATAGDGQYRHIMRVEVETSTSGLYRTIPDWDEIVVDDDPPILRLFNNHTSDRAIRLTVEQDYAEMTYSGTAPSGLQDKYERFLIEFAAGSLLEFEDLYTSDWARQTPGQPDLRGRQQAIGREYQRAAMGLLSVSDATSGKAVPRRDLRNYRR